MKFKGTNEFDVIKSRMKLEHFIDKGFNFELRRIMEVRTIKQNAYIHVVFEIWACEYGCTKNEAKTDLKRACDFMTYINKKNGKKYLKETSLMDTKELGEFIDWILIYGVQNDIFIPTSEQYLKEKFYFDQKIDEWKRYM